MWHVNPTLNCPSEIGTKASSIAADKAEAALTQSHNLISNAATRIWEELYITKKPAIEEVLNSCLLIGIYITYL